MSEPIIDPDFPPEDPVPPEPDPVEPGEEQPVVDGWTDAPVSGDRVNVFDAPIVAGDPDGARIEIRSTGFHAFNGVGTETAHIDGAEGVFVGGEFRTSDTLPGQVTLADDAYINSTTGVAHPGIRVEPLDTSTTVRPPGVGPGDLGLYVDGGSDTSGRSSYLRASPGGSLMRSLRGDGTTGGETFTSQESSLMRTYREDGIAGGEIYATPTLSIMRTYREGGTAGGEFSTSPTSSTMRTYREDGTTGGLIQTAPTESLMRTYSGNSLERGWVRVRPQDAELAYVAPDNTYFSQIKADASEAFLYTRAGGAGRYLSVDADGIWVKTNKSGSWQWYNLEDNASDSGWQAITPAPGFTAIPEGFHVRQLGRMIYLRGAVTGNVTTDWVTMGTIPAEFRPTVRQINSGASSTITNLMFQTGTSGALQVKGNNTGTGLNIFVNTILYPVD